MKINKVFSKVFTILVNLPWTLRFNFHYLPFTQACKLPIVFYVRPTFYRLKGKVRIESTHVKPNMIRLGNTVAPFLPIKHFMWQNNGTVIFHGPCYLAHNTFFSCGKDATIEIGANSEFNCGCRFISCNKLVFEDRVTVGWDCTFVDTDFHPLRDLVSNKILTTSKPITIGYGCWIGHNSIVSKGSRLPKHTIISSGSIVKGKFKKGNTIIAGNIAEVIDEGFIRDDVS